MTLTDCMSKRFRKYEGRGASEYMSIFRSSRRKHSNSAIEEVFEVVQ